MTSPVDTSVKFFTSAMPGAPNISGTAGSLISMLDALLKDGFGLESATSLIVDDGIATLTFAGGASAAMVASDILAAGATPSALNGEQKVLSADATTVTFATGEADVTATGTITFKMASLGFTKPFSGTNLAAYRSGDVAGTQMYLRVDDTGTTAARAVGYETMSDVNTGTGPFPTAAQMSGGVYWGKSSAANGTANTWTLIGDSRFFVLHIGVYSGATPAFVSGAIRAFGDFITYRPAGNAYACIITGSETGSWISNLFTGTLDLPGVGTWMPRAYTGLGTSVVAYQVNYTGSDSATTGGISGIDPSLGAFPSPVDGAMYMSQKFISPAAAMSSNAAPEGLVPGIMHVPQSGLRAAVVNWDTIAGSGAFAGRKFMALAVGNVHNGAASTANTGASLFDITGPWR